MQTIQYLYDDAGNPSAMYIDLKNSNLDDILKKPLSKSQIEILKLAGKGFSDENFNEFKKILANYLLKKIRTDSNKIWDERGYTKETFEKFVEND